MTPGPDDGVHRLVNTSEGLAGAGPSPCAAVQNRIDCQGLSAV
jgi:hypothetical protein